MQHGRAVQVNPGGFIPVQPAPRDPLPGRKGTFLRQDKIQVGVFLIQGRQGDAAGFSGDIAFCRQRHAPMTAEVPDSGKETETLKSPKSMDGSLAVYGE